MGGPAVPAAIQPAVPAAISIPKPGDLDLENADAAKEVTPRYFPTQKPDKVAQYPKRVIEVGLFKYFSAWYLRTTETVLGRESQVWKS